MCCYFLGSAVDGQKFEVGIGGHVKKQKTKNHKGLVETGAMMFYVARISCHGCPNRGYWSKMKMNEYSKSSTLCS